MTETNVFQLSQPGAFTDQLTEVLRNGARALLAQAVEAEVAALLGCHADKLTDDGRQRLVRHGHLPEREIMTGIGPVAVRCPRVRDRVGEGSERIRFSSATPTESRSSDRKIKPLPPDPFRHQNLAIPPILSADKTRVELLTSSGPVRKISPLEQARKCTFDIMRTLERDGQLMFPAGHRFIGRPMLLFGFGAVFTNITRKQFRPDQSEEVFAEHPCLFKDEMTEGADPEEFRSRCGAWFTHVSESLCRCRSLTGCARCFFPRSAYDRLRCL